MCVSDITEAERRSQVAQYTIDLDCGCRNRKLSFRAPIMCVLCCRTREPPLLYCTRGHGISAKLRGFPIQPIPPRPSAVAIVLMIDAVENNHEITNTLPNKVLPYHMARLYG